jgi:cephalosporin hydroxylase
MPESDPQENQPSSHVFVEQASLAFNYAYWNLGESTWETTTWMGVPILKTPTDLWIYQELLFRIKPRLVIETGTWSGGSALYLAHLLELIAQHPARANDGGSGGRLVSVDTAPHSPLPQHPRITYPTGSSTDPRIVQQIRAMAAGVAPVMVILDSDHARDHVLAELRAYYDLVTPGSYLIIEDTCVNGHPIFPEHGPGPMEALQQFQMENQDFEVDRTCERLMLTFNPSGYLRKRQGAGAP